MNKRKQKLEVKSEEMISAEPDPLTLSNDGNSDWLFDSENSGMDLTSSFLNEDFLNLLDIPLSLDDGSLSQENKEIFQDLKYTSTPKSRPPSERSLHDSGLEESSYKRRLKDSTNVSVLYDITEKIDYSGNNSFINLSNLSENNTAETIHRRHVPILRKDIISKPPPLVKKQPSKCISKEQLVYYTGVNDYNTAVALLKYIKMPHCDFSPFKMQLITLMKMRLNLQWKDMAFRFGVTESNLINVISKTIDIMSLTLDDFLPWHTQRKICRRSLKCFFAQAIFCEASTMQVLVLLIDGKKPVLYVSESFQLDISPLQILSKCAKFLIPGDIIGMCELSGTLSFFKVDHSNTSTGINYLQESHFSHCTFVESCQKIIAGILNDFTILSRPEDNMDLSKLFIIAGAITNINSTNELSSTQLQKIYQKSTKLICQT